MPSEVPRSKAEISKKFQQLSRSVEALKKVPTRQAYQEWVFMQGFMEALDWIRGK